MEINEENINYLKEWQSLVQELMNNTKTIDGREWVIHYNKIMDKNIKWDGSCGACGKRQTREVQMKIHELLTSAEYHAYVESKKKSTINDQN